MIDINNIKIVYNKYNTGIFSYIISIDIPDNKRKEYKKFTLNLENTIKDIIEEEIPDLYYGYYVYEVNEWDKIKETGKLDLLCSLNLHKEVLPDRILERLIMIDLDNIKNYEFRIGQEKHCPNMVYITIYSGAREEIEKELHDNIMDFQGIYLQNNENEEGKFLAIEFPNSEITKMFINLTKNS